MKTSHFRHNLYVLSTNSRGDRSSFWSEKKTAAAYTLSYFSIMEHQSSTATGGKPIRCRGMKFFIQSWSLHFVMFNFLRFWNLKIFSGGVPEGWGGAGDGGNYGGSADGSWGSGSDHLHLSLSHRHQILEDEGSFLFMLWDFYFTLIYLSFLFFILKVKLCRFKYHFTMVWNLLY